METKLQDGRTHISPSQISLFRDWSTDGASIGCNGKWGFRYLDKLKVNKEDDKGAEAKDFGHETHAHLERWLRDRVKPDESDKDPTAIAAGSLIAHEPLPDPDTPGLRVERDVVFVLPGVDADVLGKRDYFVSIPTNVRSLKGTLFAKCIIIGDHKTGKNTAKYGKRPSDLLGTSAENPGDPQVATYVLGALIEAGCTFHKDGSFDMPPELDVDHVCLRWHYVDREKFTTHTVEVFIYLHSAETRLMVKRWFFSLVFDMLMMSMYKEAVRRAYPEPELHDAHKPGVTRTLIPPELLNKDACMAFGGCAYRKVCHRNRVKFSLHTLSHEERFARQEKQMAKEDVESRVNRLRNNRAAEDGRGGDDEPRGRGRASKEDDEAPRGRGRAAKEDDDEPRGRGRGRAAKEDDDEPRGRGRASKEDDEAPRGRGRASKEDDEAPRGRGRAAKEDDDAPRGRGRGRDDDEPRGRGRAAKEDDEAPRGRGRAAKEDDEAPRGRGRGRAAKEGEEHPTVQAILDAEAVARKEGDLSCATMLMYIASMKKGALVLAAEV